MPSQAWLPWERPQWSEIAQAWTDVHMKAVGLTSLGPLQVVRTRPWAIIAKVPTDQGLLWFKEAAPVLAFEPALTGFMARHLPDIAPDVVVTEGARMLTFDAGTKLRRLRQVDQRKHWETLLPRYAEVQIALIGHVQRLVALGTPDQRPSQLLATYPRLRGLTSLVGELAEPIQPTLIHQEITAGNIFVDKGGRIRILDWAEATASHPFAGLVNTLRDIAWARRLRPNGREMIRLRDSHLEPWTQFAPMSRLNRLFERGCLLGMLCRAATWQRIMGARSRDRKFGRHAAIWMQFFRHAIVHGVEIGGPV